MARKQYDKALSRALIVRRVIEQIGGCSFEAGLSLKVPKRTEVGQGGRDFPADPMAKNFHFDCRGHGFNP